VALRFSDEKPSKVKYDGGSIFLMTLILIFTIGISAVTFAAHLVPGGTDTIKNAVFSENAAVNASYTLNSQTIKLDNNIGGDISVSAYNGNEAIIDAVVTVRNMTNEALDQKKDEIISVNKESGLISTIRPEYSSHMHNTRVNFSIKIPSGKNIEIKNQKGTVNISGTDCNITVDNKSGNIVAGNCSGSITVGSSDGSIDMNSIKGSINIVNKGGHIRVADFAAKTAINSLDGDIEILPGSQITEDVTVNSTNGILKMFLAQNQGGSLNTAVYSGDINTNIKGDIKDDGGAKKLALSLPGQGPKFDITAHNGNIELVSGKAK
jgi:hypothetical protein